MLSGRCNLSCSYCYQDCRQVRASISWSSAQAALDAALGMGGDVLDMEFSGGEPLLEQALLRRAVNYAEQHKGCRNVSFTLTTNGTLLKRELIDFLMEHDFTTRLSFDGVSAVQDLRSPGTFAVLDRLLDLLRREYPTYFRERVHVSMTLRASAIPHLAESVRYFISKGVATIGIGPRSTWEPDWGAGIRDKLQAQFAEILDLSLDHWHRNREVPVEFLAGAPLRSHKGPIGEFLCDSVRGEAMAVDPNGQAWACPLFAPSLREIPALASDASRVMALGDVNDPALRDRLRRLPRRARGLRMFTNKRAKYSSYGKCADCRFIADCHVCPASICSVPGNKDPGRVPDFICAFNQVTLAARERFDAMTGGMRSAAWHAEVRQALQGLGEAVKAAGRG
ncbi:MAG TPA: radical SAM protein [Thermoanaerobaculaceae bacterium]|nr:radical SAM protein [Thermoanaerobaculaceae bacterium]